MARCRGSMGSGTSRTSQSVSAPIFALLLLANSLSARFQAESRPFDAGRGMTENAPLRVGQSGS